MITYINDSTTVAIAVWQFSNLPATSRLFTSTQVLPATLLEPIHSLVICHHWAGCNVPCRVFCSQDAWRRTFAFVCELWGALGCNYASVGDSEILTFLSLITWYWTSVVCDFAGPSRRWRIGPCSFLVLPHGKKLSISTASWFQMLSTVPVSFPSFGWEGLVKWFCRGIETGETCHVLTFR